MKSDFVLNPRVHFLNHGSFGACPRAVLARQAELRAELESDPVQFMVCQLPHRLANAREVLANFLHADLDGLALVPNATTGVNAVLRSLPFKTGDEILITNHGYNACCNAARFVAQRAGAQVVVADIPFPITSPQQAVTAIVSAVTRNTRIAVIDHIASPTALILPIESIVQQLQERGVDVLVDGAHAAGMVPVNVNRLNAAYYTGNCHKWLCAPKGAGFLWVRKDRRALIHPTVISHGMNARLRDRSRFQLEFDWTGTTDPTAMLCIPAAIKVIGQLVDGGWSELMSRNRKLAIAARRLMLESLRSPPACPESMLGSMASVRLPVAADGGHADPLDTDPIQTRLYHDYQIEVPIFPFPAARQRMLRLSAHLYNNLDDYRILADVLPKLLNP
jgi:isopenicillin-N epimerase